LEPASLLKKKGRKLGQKKRKEKGGGKILSAITD